MTMDSWVKTYIGKGIDYDGVYGVQCVDLVNHYIDKVLGIKPVFIGNAIEFYNKRSTSSFLTNNFRWIYNTPSFVPEKGDICVFSTYSGFGHVAVCTGEGDTHYFYSYDQNYPTSNHEPMTKICHSYKNMLGVLRPLNRANINNDNRPKLSIGDAVTFTETKRCYKSFNAADGNYRICDLSHYTSTAEAKIKKGTKVTITNIKTQTNGNIWIEHKVANKNVYAFIYNNRLNECYVK